MTRSSFNFPQVKLPGLVWRQASESPGNKADPVAICGKSSNLLVCWMIWGRQGAQEKDTSRLQTLFWLLMASASVMLIEHCYKPAIF